MRLEFELSQRFQTVGSVGLVFSDVPVSDEVAAFPVPQACGALLSDHIHWHPLLLPIWFRKWNITSYLKMYNKLETSVINSRRHRKLVWHFRKTTEIKSHARIMPHLRTGRVLSGQRCFASDGPSVSPGSLDSKYNLPRRHSLPSLGSTWLQQSSSKPRLLITWDMTSRRRCIFLSCQRLIKCIGKQKAWALTETAKVVLKYVFNCLLLGPASSLGQALCVVYTSHCLSVLQAECDFLKYMYPACRLQAFLLKLRLQKCRRRASYRVG